MFLKVLRDEIIDGLNKSAGIIPAKAGAAYLRTIWIKAGDRSLNIMSTDSNLEFCGTYAADVTEDGLVGVHGRSFCDLIRKLPSGEIVMKTDKEEQYLAIEQGNRKYKLPTNDRTWFQEFSEFPANDSVFWSGDFIHDVIEKIAFCISDEDKMEAISCMNFSLSQDSAFIEVCGLNGHQFSLFRFLHEDFKTRLLAPDKTAESPEEPPEKRFLIGKKYIAELKKWLPSSEVELNVDQKRLFFRTADKKETFSLPLSFYQYPDYRTFLSKVTDGENSLLTADRLEMIDSLERIGIFNTESNRCAYFDFKDKELTLYSQGQDIGTATESLEVEFSGGLKKIAFPTRGLVEILTHFKSEKVTFKLTDNEGPCGIEGVSDTEYLVIIMPMKIVEDTYYSEEDGS